MSTSVMDKSHEGTAFHQAADDIANQRRSGNRQSIGQLRAHTWSMWSQEEPMEDMTVVSEMGSSGRRRYRRQHHADGHAYRGHRWRWPEARRWG